MAPKGPSDNVLVGPHRHALNGVVRDALCRDHGAHDVRHEVAQSRQSPDTLSPKVGIIIILGALR